MADLERIKWHAEKLHELLLRQDQNNPAIYGLDNAVTDFFSYTWVERLEAEAPPGVDEDQE